MINRKFTKYRGLRSQDIKVFDMKKYEGLDVSSSFKELANTQEGIQKIIAWCNGIGSEVGFWGNLTYHLIPNTIWFLDVTACSDIHDIDYNYPIKFATREEALKFKTDADLRLYNNLVAYIKMNTTNSWLLSMRLRRAKIYYEIVSNAGNQSFLDGKTIG